MTDAKIGFPTVNITCYRKRPACGIYEEKQVVNGSKATSGMLAVATAPPVSSPEGRTLIGYADYFIHDFFYAAASVPLVVVV